MKKASLIEALTGVTISLTTLDRRNLTIPVLDTVKPGQEIVITNEGMPTKHPLKRGDLRVGFDVLFPSRLTSEQKNDLKRVLLLFSLYENIANHNNELSLSKSFTEDRSENLSHLLNTDLNRDCSVTLV
ncbi:unnamed protein product [Eruca vesicaria subsp. sativa]|uniref:Chaperone DnaJ C-terminal domain-containing protein n=1 Tax=Eruca vesicaria subsp. sativa TaxID=29727 RepID=A0ABC8KDX0_ERUVS|nr:unnamed protein product [Eruca vesicaria subsp. sativa]